MLPVFSEITVCACAGTASSSDRLLGRPQNHRLLLGSLVSVEGASMGIPVRCAIDDVCRASAVPTNLRRNHVDKVPNV